MFVYQPHAALKSKFADIFKNNESLMSFSWFVCEDALPLERTAIMYWVTLHDKAAYRRVLTNQFGYFETYADFLVQPRWDNGRRYTVAADEFIYECGVFRSIEQVLELWENEELVSMFGNNTRVTIDRNGRVSVEPLNWRPYH